ncbi:MAG: substrate-binding domain-containing protein [Paracoccaceae bacterium]
MIKSFFLLLGFCLITNAAQAADTLRLAVTTSFHNSGLSDVLLPQIKADLDLQVQLLVVGTGQALKLGRAGDVDAILVHSEAAELAFIAAGYGTHRQKIMYNDFVVIGPISDPAQVNAAMTAPEALQKIADHGADFISRGDDSGTHKKEQSLWAAAGITPSGVWYKAVGAGMGAALNTASGLNAYVVSDRASWLNFANKGDLDLLFSGDPVLFNQYAFLPVNPERHAHIKAKLVAKLERWLISDRAKVLVNGYQIDGETLFVFNAVE